MSCKKGFLLWDTAFSFVIVALTSFLAITWYIAMLNAQTDAICRLRAVMIASQVIEQAMSRKSIDLLPKTYGIFTVRVIPKDPLENNKIWYRIVVRWNSNGKSHQVELESALYQ